MGSRNTPLKGKRSNPFHDELSVNALVDISTGEEGAAVAVATIRYHQVFIKGFLVYHLDGRLPYVVKPANVAFPIDLMELIQVMVVAAYTAYNEKKSLSPP